MQQGLSFHNDYVLVIVFYIPNIWLLHLKVFLCYKQKSHEYMYYTQIAYQWWFYLFSMFKYLIVCSYYLFISFTCISFQSFLKSNIKRKIFSYMFFKKRSILFRTNKIRFNLCFFINYFNRFPFYFNYQRIKSFSCFKKIYNSLCKF